MLRDLIFIKDILDTINKCNTINIEILLIYALLNTLYGVIPLKNLLFQEILMLEL